MGSSVLPLLQAAGITFYALVAKAFSGDHPAQLSDSTQLAQAQSPSPMRHMGNQGSPTDSQQSPANECDDDE